MEHVTELTVPAMTAWADLTHEAFLREFSEEVGVELGELTTSSSGDASLARMDWSFRTDRSGIPELARQFLPSEVHLRWNQRWDPLVDGQARGSLSVELLGRPSATSTGTCQLRDESAGSTLTTSTRTKADLPFPVAGPLESRIDKDLVGWILSVQARVLLRRNGG
jgi:hypothetical protein